MAGEWIKIQCVTPDKPEVYKIAEILDINPDAVFCKLFRIWAWADSHTYDGNAPSVTKTLLDSVAGVTGFADAMLKVEWLEKKNDGFVFVNFERHNGNTAKNRSMTNVRVAKHREYKKSEQIKKQQTQPKNGNGASVTSALPKALPEKRREDIINTCVFFEDFWNTWPKHKRKVGRKTCVAYWETNKLDKIAELITANVRAWKLSKDWKKDGGSYTPAPIVYLRRSQWESEAPKASSGIILNTAAERRYDKETAKNVKLQEEIKADHNETDEIYSNLTDDERQEYWDVYYSRLSDKAKEFPFGKTSKKMGIVTVANEKQVKDMKNE